MLVVTQNIDDLHDRAGQKNLIHMHGELLKVRCQRCSAVQQAQSAGAHTVELNLEPSDGSAVFDEHHDGPAAEVVPAYVESLRSRAAT